MQAYVVIKGITQEGKRFRPSDWAERLATVAGHFGRDRRVHYHPHVRITTVNDEKCLIVDMVLEEEDPVLCSFLLRFARDNQLQTEPAVILDADGKVKVGFD